METHKASFTVQASVSLRRTSIGHIGQISPIAFVARE
jgi:hypothetical protein